MGSLIGLLLLGALVYAVKRHLLEGRGSGSALEREELANAESARNTIGMIENPLVRGASFAAGEGSSVVANAGNSGNTETNGSASTPVYAEVLDNQSQNNVAYSAPTDDGMLYQPPVPARQATAAAAAAAVYSLPTDDGEPYQPPVPARQTGAAAAAAAVYALPTDSGEVYQVPLESGGVFYATREEVANAGAAYATTGESAAGKSALYSSADEQHESVL